MSPEELNNKIEALRADFDLLRASTTIPFDIDRAFRDRFRDVFSWKVSSKDVDSEDVSINEGGAATKIALNDPVGFLQVTLGANTYYIPYYS